MLATTWMAFSRETITERPPLIGNATLFYALSIPFVVSITTTSICGAISYAAYKVSWRCFFASWVCFLLSMGILTVVNGVKNLRHFNSVDDKFHRGQLIRMTTVVAIVFLGAGVVCFFNAVFLTQIDASDAYWLTVFGIYRVFFWFLLMGAGVYAWLATNYRVEIESRSGTQRSGSTKPSLPLRADDSINASIVGRPYSIGSPRSDEADIIVSSSSSTSTSTPSEEKQL